MRPDCMTEAEYALWQAANAEGRRPVRAPCTDCPASWAAEMLDVGRCNRIQTRGRPRTANHSEARRLAWAEKSRAYRARQRAAA